MAKIILHVDDEQRRRREIDVHGLRSRCKRNNPLLLSWADKAQSLISADLIHGTTAGRPERWRAWRSPDLQAPCLSSILAQTSARICR